MSLSHLCNPPSFLLIVMLCAACWFPMTNLKLEKCENAICKGTNLKVRCFSFKRWFQNDYLSKLTWEIMDIWFQHTLALMTIIVYLEVYSYHIHRSDHQFRKRSHQLLFYSKISWHSFSEQVTLSNYMMTIHKHSIHI